MKPVERLSKAVYGENGELALASFNELTFLCDAAEKIEALEAENAKLRDALNGVHILARCAPRGIWGYIISVDCMETVRAALEKLEAVE